MRLRLSFSVDLGPTEQRGSVFMGDWGKEAASRIRTTAEAQAQESAAQLHRQKLRNEQGPRLWAVVRDHVKTKCASLNREYGEEILTFMVVQTRELDIRF